MPVTRVIRATGSAAIVEQIEANTRGLARLSLFGMVRKNATRFVSSARSVCTKLPTGSEKLKSLPATCRGPGGVPDAPADLSSKGEADESSRSREDPPGLHVPL